MACSTGYDQYNVSANINKVVCLFHVESCLLHEIVVLP